MDLHFSYRLFYRKNRWTSLDRESVVPLVVDSTTENEVVYIKRVTKKLPITLIYQCLLI